MRQLVLWLLPAVAFGSQFRFARLGEFEGKAEVQLHAADAWAPAARNLALPELAWIRTGPSSRLELELDEGSIFRLAADSLAELSDYTRLSTGQRITMLSLDRGLAYFTGAAGGHDALILAIPGAQVTVRKGARVRLEAHGGFSQIAVIEGVVRFSSPAAELELNEGQMARVDPASRARFYLYREITPTDSDRWSEDRDKLLAAPASASHISQLRYGLADLDADGAWIHTEQYGAVWKPKVPDGWAPFQNGRWVWYDSIGYTWIAREPWGWLPFHYGRWMRTDSVGWFWVPGKSAVFKPGEVYWLRSAKAAGWGPLAPDEDWTPPAIPRLFLNANTTWAAFAADAREIDPEGFAARPKEPLATATFALALPSPAFLAARLEARRPVLRAGSTRVVPVLSGVTFENAAGAQEIPPQISQQTPPPAVIAPPPPPPVVVTVPQAERPMEVFYPAPVYTGIVVVNPPENDRHRDGRRRREQRASQPPPPRHEERPQPPPAPAVPPNYGIRRSDPGERVERRNPPPDPPPPARAEPAKPPEPEKPISRTEVENRQSERSGSNARRNQ